jgi:hypothetical protein
VRPGNAGGLIRWPVMLLLPLGFAHVCRVSSESSNGLLPARCYQMDLHYESLRSKF